MIKYMLEQIGDKYPLTEIPAGEYGSALVNGMDFTIRGYAAEGLGNIGIMTGTAGGGMMRMDTLVINPFDRDGVLFSYDRIYAPGKDMAFIECYDTRINRASGEPEELAAVKEAYKAYPDIQSQPCWYDDIELPCSIKKAGAPEQSADFDKMTEAYFDEFMKYIAKTPVCNREEKMVRARVYTEGLLTNGGASTTPFINVKGREFTEKMFRKILFGTGEPA